MYITENSTKKPEPPELPECKVEKLLGLPEYQKLANIQYQRDVKGVWISGKDYLLKFSEGSIDLSIGSNENQIHKTKYENPKYFLLSK